MLRMLITVFSVFFDVSIRNQFEKLLSDRAFRSPKYTVTFIAYLETIRVRCAWIATPACLEEYHVTLWLIFAQNPTHGCLERVDSPRPQPITTFPFANGNTRKNKQERT